MGGQWEIMGGQWEVMGGQWEIMGGWHRQESCPHLLIYYCEKCLRTCQTLHGGPQASESPCDCTNVDFQTTHGFGSKFTLDIQVTHL